MVAEIKIRLSIGFSVKIFPIGDSDIYSGQVDAIPSGLYVKWMQIGRAHV